MRSAMVFASSMALIAFSTVVSTMGIQIFSLPSFLRDGLFNLGTKMSSSFLPIDQDLITGPNFREIFCLPIRQANIGMDRPSIHPERPGIHKRVLNTLSMDE